MSSKANQIISTLFNDGHQDKDTLGLLARTNKDLWLQEMDPYKKEKFKETAIKHYLDAYNLYRSPWTGINAATLFYISKNISEAQRIATELKDDILREYEKYRHEDGEYWTLATLAEAFLILNNFEDATKCYQEAQKYSLKKYGNINSSWKNALLLMNNIGVEKNIREEITKSFDFPNILIFSGHMVDNQTKTTPRFPEAITDQVYEKIYKRLSSKNNLITFSSLANGADILFVEAAEKLNAKINIVLPCSIELFNQTSVQNSGTQNWSERFYKIINSAANKHILHRNTNQLTSAVYSFANEITYGLGKNHAKNLNAKIQTMAVLSNADEGKLGGARSVVDFWESKKEIPDIIDLSELDFFKTCKSNSKKATNIAQDQSKESDNETRKKMAILFADTENYSKLKDEEFPLFEKHLLGLAQSIIISRKFNVCSKNSWGDALFLVFDNIKDAGVFALELTEEIEKIDWITKGFGQKIRLRIALHAGIVFESISPITGQITYNGEDVCRTSRIEGVTPPGQVFASMEFATLAEAEHITSFDCTYVGKITMPKRYGIFPTYHVTKNKGPQINAS